MKIKIQKEDTEWARQVRERDKKCLYCRKTQYLQAHHLFGRSRSSTRYNLLNGFTLCAKHHVFSNEFSAHRTNETFKIWAKAYLGKKVYQELKKLSEVYMSREKAKKQFMKELNIDGTDSKELQKKKYCIHNGKKFVSEFCALHLSKKKKKSNDK